MKPELTEQQKQQQRQQQQAQQQKQQQQPKGSGHPGQAPYTGGQNPNPYGGSQGGKQGQSTK